MRTSLRKFQRGDSPKQAANHLVSEIRKLNPQSKAPPRRPTEFIGQIRTAGPQGEADFSDARYWVQAVRFDRADENSPAQWIDYDPADLLYVEAVNIAEVADATHTLGPDTAVIVREIADAKGHQVWIFNPGGGGGVGVIEVRIAKAIASLADTANPREFDLHQQYGPHLKCHQIDAMGNFVMEEYEGQQVPKYVVVMPNWPHPVSDFKNPDGSQIYNAFSPTAPVFTAFNGVSGFTLSFLEGERLVPAPSNASLCAADPAAPEGACCLASQDCLILTAEECSIVGGMYVGDDTTCAPPTDCTNAMGACCSAGGSCALMSQMDCINSGQGYIGDGTTCNPNPCGGGACCAPGGSCLQFSEAECLGSGYTYQGDGTSCEPSPCGGGPAGACCSAGGSCSLLTQLDCEGSGQTYQGDNVPCSPNPCGEVFACCHGQSECDDMTSFNCAAVVGVWLNGATCAQVGGDSACSTFDGACCQGTFCSDITGQQSCLQGGGVFQGIGSTCTPNPCGGGLSDPDKGGTPPPSLTTRKRNTR